MDVQIRERNNQVQIECLLKASSADLAVVRVVALHNRDCCELLQPSELRPPAAELRPLFALCLKVAFHLQTSALTSFCRQLLHCL